MVIIKFDALKIVKKTPDTNVFLSIIIPYLFNLHMQVIN